MTVIDWDIHIEMQYDLLLNIVETLPSSADSLHLIFINYSNIYSTAHPLLSHWDWHYLTKALQKTSLRKLYLVHVGYTTDIGWGTEQICFDSEKFLPGEFPYIQQPHKSNTLS